MSKGPPLQSNRFPFGLKSLMVGLALTKIWLAKALPLAVIADSDEKTFLLQAQGLLSGHWLGEYTVVTLVKMPLYSVFLAATFLVGIPVTVAQQALYAIACGIFLVAVRPMLRTWQPVRFAILYAFLVFNPMAGLGGERLLRNHFYASLGVFLISGAAGTLIRIRENWNLSYKWQFLFTVALTAQWLTREESPWVAPFLILYTLTLLFLMWRGQIAPKLSMAAFAVAPYAAVVLGLLTVAALNHHKYGLFVLNEQQSGEMNDAVGAIHRVTPKSERSHYDVVTNETRERIYAVSPAFAELRNSLEGEPGKIWAAPSCQVDRVCSGNDVGWGWFNWELRHAALIAGHQSNAVDGARFYARIAAEINGACTDGRLACDRGRSSTMPPWELHYTPEALRVLGKVLISIVTFHGFTLEPTPNEGDPELLAQYSDLTHEVIITDLRQLRVSGWILSTASPVEISVQDATGNMVEYSVRRVARPDVVEFAKNRGFTRAVDGNSGFQLSAECRGNCFLFARGGKKPDTWQRIMPLDGIANSYIPTPPASSGKNLDPHLAALESGDILAYLDNVNNTENLNSRIQPRLNAQKVRLLAKIGAIYRLFVPVLFIIACGIVGLGVLQYIRFRSLPIEGQVAAAIIVLMLNRLSAMVFIDVLAISTISTLAEYEQYVYPLLLMFIGLVVMNPAQFVMLNQITTSIPHPDGN